MPIMHKTTLIQGEDWPEATPILLSHPLEPEQIRKDIPRDVGGMAIVLHRVPTDINTEWWLFSKQGDLLEVYWLE